MPKIYTKCKIIKRKKKLKEVIFFPTQTSVHQLIHKPHQPILLLLHIRSYKAAAAAPAAATPPPRKLMADEKKAIRKPGFLKLGALMRFLPKMDSITQQQLQTHGFSFSI
ncbi:hypothetical protein ACP275_12G031600 [Erythranthe tilingii]